MTCRSMFRLIGWLPPAMLPPAMLPMLMFGLTLTLLGVLATASAQYGSSYPYARPPAARRQLPTTARHVGGFTGNPYRSSGVAPSGLPVGGNRSYYGGGGGRSSLGYRAPAKPFSNLHRPKPLVTSRDAARIEVARGLWRY